MKLYSADRRGFYQHGKLMLFKTPHDPLMKFEDSPRGDFGGEEVLKHMLALFPDGLSPHGWDHAIRPANVVVFTSATTSITAVEHSCAIEMLFEFVRRENFKHRPSRFQSYYAFDSIAEVEEFTKLFPDKTFPIYELNSAGVFKCDQKWMNVSDNIGSAFYRAHQFWTGAATKEPKWEYMLQTPITTTPV
ncbi:DUF2441 domain-containing protein [Rhizobium grahamii]|uniref:DUF2441 domain-containing protein n=1 Tax=Rhizobium grahamii TaxID=1120045 RepID=A0A370KRK7_9HYPH|nr:DUF2441 domain-containing protein [Rhizobium grahamii]RDJ12429.1 hypothetical protein B5K06_11895 [Rhizobium grahamii]